MLVEFHGTAMGTAVHLAATDIDAHQLEVAGGAACAVERGKPCRMR